MNDHKTSVEPHKLETSPQDLDVPPEIVMIGSVKDITQDNTGASQSDGPKWTNKSPDDRFPR